MPLLARVARVLRRFRHGDRLDDELDEELRGYVDALVTRYLRDGLTPDAARRAALLEVGGLDSVKESVRDIRAGRWIESSIQDLRFAWRGLRRAPGFSIVIVL